MVPRTRVASMTDEGSEAIVAANAIPTLLRGIVTASTVTLLAEAGWPGVNSAGPDGGDPGIGPFRVPYAAVMIPSKAIRDGTASGFALGYDGCFSRQPPGQAGTTTQLPQRKESGLLCLASAYPFSCAGPAGCFAGNSCIASYYDVGARRGMRGQDVRPMAGADVGSRLCMCKSTSGGGGLGVPRDPEATSLPFAGAAIMSLEQGRWSPYGDPSTNDCGGSGGGGDSRVMACHAECGFIEASYDGGPTWEPYWEGYYNVCEYQNQS